MPIRAFDSGRIGRAACSGAGLSLAKRVGSHQKCTTDERRTVLSINPRGGIDLDTLDAVALPPDCSVGSLTDSMGNRRRAQGDTRRRAHGCTHRTHGVDFETRDAVSMRRRGQPNDAGVAWVVATPGPKRFSTSKQSPIRQQHQQLKVPMPSDVRALIERKHTTITAVRGDPRRIGRVLGTPVPTERPATAPAGRRPYEAPRPRPQSCS